MDDMQLQGEKEALRQRTCNLIFRKIKKKKHKGKQTKNE